MKNKWKISLVFALSLALCWGIYSIVQVNVQYPQVQIKGIPVLQYEELENGVFMKVLSSQIRSKDESEKKFGENFVKQMEENVNYRTVEVKVELFNQSEQKRTIYLYETYLESINYNNGIAPEVYQALEEDDDMELTLYSGERREVSLGYVLFETQFNKRQWKNMKGEQFFLVNRRYPVKYRWNIS